MGPRVAAPAPGEAEAGRGRGGSSRSTPPPASARARAWCRSRRSSTPPTSRPRTAATARSPARAGADVARRALEAAGLAPARDRPRRERLLHRLHDPGRRRPRGRRPGAGPAPRPPADHRVGLRRRRRRPRPRRRLPRRPPRPGGAPPGPRVLQPHLPALGPLARRTSSRPRSSATAARPRCSSARATRARRTGLVRVREAESRFFPGTTHLMGFELRNQGLQIVLDKGLAPFVRREIVPAVEGFLAPRGLARDDVAPLDPAPRGPARHRGDGRAAGPRAPATSPRPRPCSPSTAT